MRGIFLYPAREMPRIPACERDPGGAAFRIFWHLTLSLRVEAVPVWTWSRAATANSARASQKTHGDPGGISADCCSPNTSLFAPFV